MKRLLLALAFAAPLAHAADGDVLFIGMNASYHEIQAAEAAAKKSGRKLVVFPEMTVADHKKFYDLTQAYSAAQKKLDKACSKDAQSAGCQSVQKKLQPELERMNKARNDMRALGEFNKEKFDQFLKGRGEKANRFESVVVSGHDGTGHLSGDFGSISDKELAEVLNANGLRDSVRSLHLWGCYTASPSSVMINWKSAFPNIHFVSGYDGRAPLADKPAGWSYLKGVIEREPKLHAIADAKKLQQALREIPGAVQVNAAMANCDFYANHKEAFDIGAFVEQCKKYKTEIEAAQGKYECYLKAEAGCENVPVETGSGVLREFYGIMQKADACKQVTPSPTFEAHSRDEAMRLLFYRDVAKNFSRLYQQELKEYDEMLAALGAPEKLRVADLGSLSRKDMIARLDELAAFIRGKFMDFEMDPKKYVTDTNTARLSALRNFQQQATGTLVGLGSGCVPYSWHEAGATEASQCFDKKMMGRAAVDEALKDSTNLKRFALNATSEEMRKALNNGELGSSYGDRLLYEARIQLIDAVAYASDGEKFDWQERNIRWAEAVRRLEKAGVTNPTEDDEPRRIQYEVRAEKLRNELKSAASTIEQFTQMAKNNNNDESFTKIVEQLKSRNETTQLVLDALELKRKSITADIPETERQEARRALAAKEAELGEQLMPRRKQELTDQIKSLQQMQANSERNLNEFRNFPTIQEELRRGIENTNKVMAESKELLELAEREPDAFRKKLVENEIEALPITVQGASTGRRSGGMGSGGGIMGGRAFGG